MKLETFFEKFELFAEAPGGVGRLRELVLQLAVRGRLVHQNSQDEPAINAVEKIVDINDSRRNTKLSAIEKLGESLEPIFDIPSSWKWVRFGDVVRIRTGKLDANAAVADGEYPFFTCSKTPSRIATYSFDTSAVILAGNGDFNLKSYTGKFDAYQRTYVIEPLGWELGFCFWLISAQIKRITDSQRGSAIPYLRLGDITDPLVPFPPLAEQKRITARVNELMAMCAQLETQKQEREAQRAKLARASLTRFAEAPTPANFASLFHPSYDITPADLRKSILTLAVQGKLVSQDPNDEPAETLIARVAAEKKRLVQAQEIKSESPLDSISDNEALFSIPDSWTWLRAGDLCKPISSGSTPEKSVFHPFEGIPFLKVYNIRNQELDFDYKRQFVAVEHHDKQMKRSKLFPGDVIMNIVGPPLGKVAIIPDTFPEWNCNQAIAFFRPVLPGFSAYLYTFLKEGSFLKNIQLIGTAGQDNISVTKCKFIPVPIPPLAEQHRIVVKVEQMMALVDQLESQLEICRMTAKNLLDAIVAELTMEA